MYKWSVLIECDAENMAEFHKEHYDGQSMFIKGENVIGIMKVEDEKKV